MKKNILFGIIVLIGLVCLCSLVSAIEEGWVQVYTQGQYANIGEAWADGWTNYTGVGWANATTSVCNFTIEQGKIKIEGGNGSNIQCDMMKDTGAFNSSRKIRVLVNSSPIPNDYHYTYFGLGSNGSNMTYYGAANKSAGYGGGAKVDYEFVGFDRNGNIGGSVNANDWDTSKWYYWEWMWNSSSANEFQLHQWLNTTVKGPINYTADADAINPASQGSYLFIGSHSNTQIKTMYVTDITIFNKSDTVPPPEGTINLTGVALPANGTHINTQPINFNASFNATFPFNCSLKINDTINITRTGFGTGTNIYVEFNGSGFQEIHYNFSIRCFDNSSEDNTVGAIFLFDSTLPIVTTSPTLESNKSIAYGINGRINATILSEDTNLWGINITVDGTTIIFNKTNLGTTSYLYNLSFKPNDYGLSLGVHKLTVEVSDSHTSSWIPYYDYSKNLLDKSITYTFDSGWIKIKPTNKGLFSKFNTWKEKDRYSFSFKKDWIGKMLYGDDMEFEVTSSDLISIPINSNYDGHLVINGLSKWLDFETGNSKAVVSMKQITDTKILVQVNGIEEDDIIFNSLGGLNVVTNNYLFYYGNVTETYYNRTLETSSTTFTLNFTRNISHVLDATAILHYNNTQYIPTKTTTTEYIFFDSTFNIALFNSTQPDNVNTTFFWRYNVTNAGAGSSVLDNTTTTANHSLYKMIISNCSFGNATEISLNFSILDEINLKPISPTLGATFTVWNRSSTVSRTYPLQNSADSNISICMYPDWAELYADINTEFTLSGYDSRSYIKLNERIQTNNTPITIYMASTANTTGITISVVDEDDFNLVGYTVEAWRYNIVTNDYTLIQTKITDSEGESLFYLYVAASEYMFKVYNPTGILVHTEAKQLLVDTSYTLRVIVGTSPSSMAIKLNQLDYTLTADKTLKNISLKWDDTLTNLIDNINLTIAKQNTTGTSILYSSLSTANTGTLSYNLSASGIYVGYAYAKSTEDGTTYLLDSVSLDIREEWDVFGTETLTMAFFFIGTMAFIGIGISAEISIVFLLLGLVLFVGLGFLHLTFAAVMSIVVSGIIVLVRLKKR